MEPPLHQRYLLQAVEEDLKNKMAFLAGPRQVGKTTFAVELVGAHYRSQYYTWDKIALRRAALKGEWPADAELIILDEFHKHPSWKTWIKGEYDTLKHHHKFLLTGSARLDVYRRGGDSLQGRYHFYRLHPFSVAELRALLPDIKPGQEPAFPDAQSSDEAEALRRFGGFPEPLLKQDDESMRRWHQERLERFFQEDIRDLTRIQDIGNLTLLADLLTAKVSSILSINSLAGDLQVNFRTLSNWLDAFENLYYCYRLPPYQSRKIASVRKEKKLYLWDWSAVPSEGARLENMVASHLLKFCHYLSDRQGWNVELFYLRDNTGREVDFLVCQDRRPWFAVEVKKEDAHLSKHLFYFQKKLNIPFCYQVVWGFKNDIMKDGVRVMPAAKFLGGLA